MKTDEYAMIAGYVGLAQWAFRSFGGEATRTTLVFALAFCYTGLRAEVGYPYAQAMAESGEPRYQQKEITINRSRWRFMIFLSVIVRD